jgi:hypothetical protein
MRDFRCQISGVRKNKMKKFAALAIFISIMILGKTLFGASLYSSDPEEYRVKIKSKRDPWGLITLHQGSYRYFDCTCGCEIEILETGSTIRLKSDADVIIDNGTLKTR